MFCKHRQGNSRTPLSADSPRAFKYSHLLFSFPSIQQVFPTTLSLLYPNPNQHPNTYSQCLLVAKARPPLRLSPLPDLPRPVSSVSLYLIDHTLIILLLWSLVPVGRIHRLLKKGNYAQRIGSGAPVYLAAVLECKSRLVLDGHKDITLTTPF